MKTALCRSCKKPIVWLTTKNGRTMPVDEAGVSEGDVVFDATRHVSHFSTCPAADTFRKKK